MQPHDSMNHKLDDFCDEFRLWWDFCQSLGTWNPPSFVSFPSFLSHPVLQLLPFSLPSRLINWFSLFWTSCLLQSLLSISSPPPLHQSFLIFLPSFHACHDLLLDTGTTLIEAALRTHRLPLFYEATAPRSHRGFFRAPRSYYLDDKSSVPVQAIVWGFKLPIFENWSFLQTWEAN